MSNPVLVIDYAWWRPNFQTVKTAGYSAIIRYVSHDKSKSLTADELSGAHSAGLGVGVVFEDSAQRALAGAPAGTADGQFANAYLDSIGWPRWKPCGFAIDFQPTAAQMPTILAYVQAADQAGPRKAFGYGSTDVVDALVGIGIPDDWQTCAWSHGLVNNKAALYQRLKPTTGLQGSFDEDVVLHPSNDLWFPGEQPPTEGTVLLIYADGLDAMTAAGIAFPRRVGEVTTNLTAAKDAQVRRDELVVLGGPAAANLGQDPKKIAGTPFISGTTTYLVGATAEDTRAMGEAHIK